MKKKKKAVVVLSGGMDSTTALYQARDDGFDEIYAISFDYGQRHKKELEYARRIAEGIAVVHEIVDISSITKLIDNSSLTGNKEVPEGHYSDETMKATVVPNRNMIMYSIAIGYAVNIGAKAMYIGVHAGDHPIYPDCRLEFVYGLHNLAKIATEGFAKEDFRIVSPFVNMEKHDIVSVGTILKVPYEKTWSCYKGKEKHCGKCGTCIERKEAFTLAKVKDLTEYEN